MLLSSLVLCPLASCPVMVAARMLACLCATCARARWCCDCGGWPLLVFFGLQLLWLQTPYWFCRCFPLPCCPLPMAPKVRGERRAAERADREAAERRVRQRLDEVEQRIDEAETMRRNHDQRISFQESPQRLVLRGFACVGEFFRARGDDFALAKRAFIGAFFQELKEHCGPEVTHHIEEAEGLLADRNGLGGPSEYIQQEGLLTILLTGSFACNQALSVTVRVTFCALRLFACNVLANFFRIGCVGLTPRARAKGRARRVARERERVRIMGPSPRGLRHPTVGRRESLP